VVSAGRLEWRSGDAVSVPVNVTPPGTALVFAGLPGWLSSPGAAGPLSGIAPATEVPATFPFSVTAGAVAREFVLTVHPEAQVSLPDDLGLEENVTGSTDAPALAGAVGPVSWSLASGTLPPGTVVVPSSGAVSGTPTAYGSYGPLQLAATDSLGTVASAPFTVEVSPGTVEAVLPSGTDVPVASLFTSGDWVSARTKVVLVPEGAVVGATSPSVAAVSVDAQLGGSLRIVNRGRLLGAGGRGDGGHGGDAIVSDSDRVTVENHGDIWAGGGAGGRGGNGGAGHVDGPVEGPYYYRGTLSRVWEFNPDNGLANLYWDGIVAAGVTGTEIRAGGYVYLRGTDQDDPYGVFRPYSISRKARTDTVGGVAADAGAGTGYLQDAGVGAGAVSGGEGAGASGTSGAGGDWGMPGADGTRGSDGIAGAGAAGTAGGLPGHAIRGPATLVDAGGSVRGR